MNAPQHAALASFFGGDTLYRDWDYFTSGATTLQLYASQYHTVPTWNFMLCGGRPELANPQSWAWTWPSLLTYLLPGNAAFVALWALMSVAGFCAMLVLLRRLGVRAPAAFAGALLYVANGFFASHFNQGHATYAFFHLIPVLMLSALRLRDAMHERRVLTGPLAAMIALSFLFFSAALPHALFYFYPAFVVFVAALVWQGVVAGAAAGAAKMLGLLAAAHGLGAALAAYKLWPMISWQLARPRTSLRPEALSFGDVMANTLRYIPDYHELAARYFDAQVWSAWEYNAYVGPVAWGIVPVAAAWWLRAKMQDKQRGLPDPLLPLCGLVCCALGFLLALGNENPVGPARLFEHLPLLGGIRIFGRYQVLIVFGLGLLVAWSVAVVASRIESERRRTAAQALLAACVCAPALWQAGALAGNVERVDEAWLRQKYALTGSPAAAPELAVQHFDPATGGSHQNHLLREGFWVNNCYDPMNIDRVFFRADRLRPLTTPAPERVVGVTSDAITLAFDASATGRVLINLVAGADFEFNVATRAERDGRRSFLAEDLPDRTLTMRRPPVVEMQGAAMSLAGLLAAIGLVIFSRRF